MKILAGTVAIGLVGCMVASAGEPATLGIGSRVRVQQGPRKDNPKLAGRVVATDADTLTLSLDGGSTRSVPWSSVRRIEVSQGRRSAGAGMLRGAGIGLALGVVAGALVGATRPDDRCYSDPRRDTWCLELFTTNDYAFLGAITLGGTGAVVGGGVGAAWRGERWAPVREPRLSLAPTPGPGGRGAGLALRFDF
jgi:hypothetical protein